tara:strand:+ start:428 stop:733 length:306 start_codon:yes stop_codon:yes gene_type:complete
MKMSWAYNTLLYQGEIMGQLIGFDVYRTESISVAGVPYIIRFSESKDGQEYKLFVSNGLNNNQASYSFAKEVADDFRHYHGRELESEVAKIIESDVQAGIL